MGLAGRVALVTGDGRRIGRGVAEERARRGTLVAVNDVRDDIVGVASGLRHRGLHVLGVVGSVSWKPDVEAMVERVETDLGPLWLLVNNAGVIPTGPTVHMREEDWDLARAVDAKGVFLCSQAAIRRMMPRHAGRIVSISSTADGADACGVSIFDEMPGDDPIEPTAVMAVSQMAGAGTP